MRRGRGRVRVTAGFCIGMAISLCILPLKWVGGWLLAITVHEISHCIAVKACGANLQQCKLTTFGAEIFSDINRPWKEIVCSLAGPFGGFLLLFFRKFIPIAALCGLIHSVYNLLPLKTLDGGWALHGILRIFLKEDQVIAAQDIIDRVFRVVLFVFALYMSWRLRWWVLALFSGVLLFRNARRSKSTCKHEHLQVQ